MDEAGEPGSRPGGESIRGVGSAFSPNPSANLAGQEEAVSPTTAGEGPH
jgi:hypothetical protein